LGDVPRFRGGILSWRPVVSDRGAAPAEKGKPEKISLLAKSYFFTRGSADESS
jgi:hypothetical protein